MGSLQSFTFQIQKLDNIPTINLDRFLFIVDDKVKFASKT